jgi:site-specific recombinase XerD
MGVLPGWAELEAAVPQVAATMRRYLTQIGCVLRPGSVGGADLALRSFAAFLAQAAPEVTSIAQVTRAHIEDYKPWLAARPGQNKPRLTPATIIHRLGTLRMFFIRLDEWGWDQAPPRVLMFTGDLPRQDHPLPRALDDASAARLLRAAQADKRLLVRVTVEMLLRTGLRVSEYISLRADAVVQIGAGPWLHVPVGKLREDRYLPLHPHLVALIDDYRARHVDPASPLLLPRENGKPADRHAVTRYINKAGAAAGLPHIHPHQLRHTLATQAINRGMSLEAIAAMLGHRSLDMTLRYARIASRTVADEYFAVTEKVEALYGQPAQLPADAIGPKMARLRREHHRMLGNGWCTRPPLRLTRPGQLPAPAAGPDSLQVLDEAVDQLARLRTPYWLGDSAVRLHALASLIAQAQQLLPQAVHDARDQELTWTQIGELLNVTAATAARRYRNNQ